MDRASEIRDIKRMADELGIPEDSYMDKPKVSQWHHHNGMTREDSKKIKSNRKRNKLAAKARRRNK